MYSAGNRFFSVKRPYKVIICIVTVWSFLFNTVFQGIGIQDLAWAQRSDLGFTGTGPKISSGPGQKMARLVRTETFNLPSYLGQVKHAAKGASRKVIFHIQDAHCNYPAQLKIAEIIDYLAREYDIKLVNLEGGEGEYVLSIFTDIQNRKLRKKVSDYFLKHGEINGAEFFAINNPDRVRLYGIEDAEHYIENLNAYRKTLKLKPGIDKGLKGLSQIIDSLKTKIYSQKLLELDRKYKDYKHRELDFKTYVSYLVDESDKRGLDLKDFKNLYFLDKVFELEKVIDFKKCNRERDVLIDELQKVLSELEVEELVKKVLDFKLGRITQTEFYTYLTKKAKELNIELGMSSNLKLYIGYITIYESIDKDMVFAELEGLEDAINETLFENDTQRELNTLSKRLEIIKGISDISLTRDEYRIYLARRDEFKLRNFTSFIQKEAPKYNIPSRIEKDIEGLDGYLNKMRDFYKCADRRDMAFVNNSKWAMKSSKAEMAIMVSGGFHTDGLKELCKRNNISYIAILPNFRNGNGYKSPYFKLLSGGSSPLTDYIYTHQSSIAVASYLNNMAANPKVKGWDLINAFDNAVEVVTWFFDDEEKDTKTLLGIGLEFSRHGTEDEIIPGTKGEYAIYARVTGMQPRHPPTPEKKPAREHREHKDSYKVVIEPLKVLLTRPLMAVYTWFASTKIGKKMGVKGDVATFDKRYDNIIAPIAEEIGFTLIPLILFRQILPYCFPNTFTPQTPFGVLVTISAVFILLSLSRILRVVLAGERSPVIMVKHFLAPAVVSLGIAAIGFAMSSGLNTIGYVNETVTNFETYVLVAAWGIIVNVGIGYIQDSAKERREFETPATESLVPAPSTESEMPETRASARRPEEPARRRSTRGIEAGRYARQIEGYAKRNISLDDAERRIALAFIDDLKRCYKSKHVEKAGYLTVMVRALGEGERVLDEARRIWASDNKLREEGYRITPEILMLYRQMRRAWRERTETRETYEGVMAVLSQAWAGSRECPKFGDILGPRVDEHLEECIREGRERLYDVTTLDGMCAGVEQAVANDRYDLARMIAVQLLNRDLVGRYRVGDLTFSAIMYSINNLMIEKEDHLRDRGDKEKKELFEKRARYIINLLRSVRDLSIRLAPKTETFLKPGELHRIRYEGPFEIRIGNTTLWVCRGEHAPNAAPYRLDETKYYVFGNDPSTEYEEIPFGRANTLIIGRGSLHSFDIAGDAHISRRHMGIARARYPLIGERIIVEDLRSENGTQITALDPFQARRSVTGTIAGDSAMPIAVSVDGVLVSPKEIAGMLIKKRDGEGIGIDIEGGLPGEVLKELQDILNERYRDDKALFPGIELYMGTEDRSNIFLSFITTSAGGTKFPYKKFPHGLPKIMVHTHDKGPLPSATDLFASSDWLWKRPERGFKFYVIVPGVGRTEYSRDEDTYDVGRYDKLHQAKVDKPYFKDGKLRTEGEWVDWFDENASELEACGVKLHFVPWSRLPPDNVLAETELDRVAEPVRSSATGVATPALPASSAPHTLPAGIDATKILEPEELSDKARAFVSEHHGEEVSVGGIVSLLRRVRMDDKSKLQPNQVAATVYEMKFLEPVTKREFSSPVIYTGNMYDGFDEIYDDESGNLLPAEEMREKLKDRKLLEDFTVDVAKNISVKEMRDELENIGIARDHLDELPADAIRREFYHVLFLKKRGDKLLSDTGLISADEHDKPLRVALHTYDYGNRTAYLPMEITVFKMPDGKVKHYWGYLSRDEVEKRVQRTNPEMAVRGDDMEYGTALRFKGGGTYSYKEHARRTNHWEIKEGFPKRLDHYASRSRRMSPEAYFRGLAAESEIAFMRKLSNYCCLLAQQFWEKDHNEAYKAFIAGVEGEQRHTVKLGPERTASIERRTDGERVTSYVIGYRDKEIAVRVGSKSEEAIGIEVMARIFEKLISQMLLTGFTNPNVLTPRMRVGIPSLTYESVSGKTRSSKTCIVQSEEGDGTFSYTWSEADVIETLEGQSGYFRAPYGPMYSENIGGSHYIVELRGFTIIQPVAIRHGARLTYGVFGLLPTGLRGYDQPYVEVVSVGTGRVNRMTAVDKYVKAKETMAGTTNSKTWHESKKLLDEARREILERRKEALGFERLFENMGVNTGAFLRGGIVYNSDAMNVGKDVDIIGYVGDFGEFVLLAELPPEDAKVYSEMFVRKWLEFLAYLYDASEAKVEDGDVAKAEAGGDHLFGEKGRPFLKRYLDNLFSQNRGRAASARRYLWKNLEHRVEASILDGAIRGYALERDRAERKSINDLIKLYTQTRDKMPEDKEHKYQRNAYDAAIGVLKVAKEARSGRLVVRAQNVPQYAELPLELKVHMTNYVWARDAEIVSRDKIITALRKAKKERVGTLTERVDRALDSTSLTDEGKDGVRTLISKRWDTKAFSERIRIAAQYIHKRWDMAETARKAKKATTSAEAVQDIIPAVPSPALTPATPIVTTTEALTPAVRHSATGTTAPAVPIETVAPTEAVARASAKGTEVRTEIISNIRANRRELMPQEIDRLRTRLTGLLDRINNPRNNVDVHMREELKARITMLLIRLARGKVATYSPDIGIRSTTQFVLGCELGADEIGIIEGAFVKTKHIAYQEELLLGIIIRLLNPISMPSNMKDAIFSQDKFPKDAVDYYVRIILREIHTKERQWKLITGMHPEQLAAIRHLLYTDYPSKAKAVMPFSNLPRSDLDRKILERLFLERPLYDGVSGAMLTASVIGGGKPCCIVDVSEAGMTLLERLKPVMAEIGVKADISPGPNPNVAHGTYYETYIYSVESVRETVNSNLSFLQTQLSQSEVSELQDVGHRLHRDMDEHEIEELMHALRDNDSDLKGLFLGYTRGAVEVFLDKRPERRETRITLSTFVDYMSQEESLPPAQLNPFDQVEVDAQCAKDALAAAINNKIRCNAVLEALGVKQALASLAEPAARASATGVPAEAAARTSARGTPALTIPQGLDAKLDVLRIIINDDKSRLVNVGELRRMVDKIEDARSKKGEVTADRMAEALLHVVNTYRCALEVLKRTRAPEEPRFIFIPNSKSLCPLDPIVARSKMQELWKGVRNEFGERRFHNLTVIFYDGTLEDLESKLKPGMMKDNTFAYVPKGVAEKAEKAKKDEPARMRYERLRGKLRQLKEEAPPEGSYVSVGAHVSLALGILDLIKNRREDTEYAKYVSDLIYAMSGGKTTVAADKLIEMIKKDELDKLVLMLPPIAKAEINEDMTNFFLSEEAVLKSL